MTNNLNHYQFKKAMERTVSSLQHQLEIVITKSFCQFLNVRAKIMEKTVAVYGRSQSLWMGSAALGSEVAVDGGSVNGPPFCAAGGFALAAAVGAASVTSLITPFCAAPASAPSPAPAGFASVPVRIIS